MLLDRFVYNTVFANGRAWNTLTMEGEDAGHLKSVSTKAAIGWDVIYETPYTAMLRRTVLPAKDAQKGWLAGVYEASGQVNAAATANTNGIILQSLYFKQFGPMLSLRYRS